MTTHHSSTQPTPEAEINRALAPLLAAIEGENPCGEPLRYDPLYDQIKELRRHDDPSLPQGVWKHELKRGDYKSVAAACAQALAERSKDLQLAGWLTEAWTHREGLAGFERGLRLLDGLCERYWDGLYPRLEDDDADFRLAPLHWLVDHLPIVLKQIPFTAPRTEQELLFTWNDQLSAQRTANLARTDPKIAEAAEKAGKATVEKIRLGLSLTPAPFLHDLSTHLDRCLTALARLDERLTEHCGTQAPSFAAPRDLLREMHGLARRTLAEHHPGEAPSNDASDPPDEDPSDASQETLPMAESEPTSETAGESAAVARDPISSRAQAYRQLAEAADYLLRTEPHSPTPYLVRRAVAWGGLTLGELLDELLSGGTDINAIHQLLGITSRQ